MPESTSPDPPLASAGLPVILIQVSPEAPATTVLQPFSTTQEPVTLAIRRATPVLSDWISFAEIPRRRAASPGCGVRTRKTSVPPAGLISPTHPAKALTP